MEDENGQTAVIVGTQKGILGIISIADKIRDDAENLTRNPKDLGVKKSLCLQGIMRERQGQ